MTAQDNDKNVQICRTVKDFILSFSFLRFQQGPLSRLTSRVPMQALADQRHGRVSRLGPRPITNRRCRGWNASASGSEYGLQPAEFCCEETCTSECHGHESPDVHCSAIRVTPRFHALRVLQLFCQSIAGPRFPRLWKLTPGSRFRPDQQRYLPLSVAAPAAVFHGALVIGPVAMT
jgi:hypothetical protein